MTVIAAKIEKDKIVMSCDSLVTRGWHSKSTGYDDKIIVGPDFLIGIAGLARTSALMQVFSKNHPLASGSLERMVEWCYEFTEYCNKHVKKWDQNANNCILAHEKRLVILENWTPLEVTDYCAIGSGYQHAEAAMYLGCSTREAVDVAINMAYGCGGNIITRSIDYNP